MDSLWAQIESIACADKDKNPVYQWVATFKKGSIWAHCTSIKGLKEF